MSTTTNEIIEKLKSITLLEAAELVKQIEDTFGVDTSIDHTSVTKVPFEESPEAESLSTEEADSFDVILEQMPEESQKSQRLAIFRIIREITSLGLKESKELTNSLPKSIKESISKNEAEEAKKQLEAAGAKIRIQ